MKVGFSNEYGEEVFVAEVQEQEAKVDIGKGRTWV